MPRDAPALQAAERRATDLRDRLVALQEIQALGAWLDQRPQLGREVFARGRAEAIGSVIGGSIEVDMIAFLWACLDQLLPDPNQQAAQPQTETRLRRRSALSSTFVASLELAKQGDVVLMQTENFDPIIVSVNFSHQPLPNISWIPSASP